MGFTQTRILEWLLFPSPGDLRDPGIKPMSPAGRFFTKWATGINSAYISVHIYIYIPVSRFIHPSFPLSVVKRLFSVSLFLLCKQDHLYQFSRSEVLCTIHLPTEPPGISYWNRAKRGHGDLLSCSCLEDQCGQTGAAGRMNRLKVARMWADAWEGGLFQETPMTAGASETLRKGNRELAP